MPSAAAAVQIERPTETPSAAKTPDRRPPTRAFLVTIAVSGPGMTISRTAIARKGSNATCTGPKYAERDPMIVRLSLTLC